MNNEEFSKELSYILDLFNKNYITVNGYYELTSHLVDKFNDKNKEANK